MENIFIIDIDHTIIDTSQIKTSIVGLISQYQKTSLEQVNATINAILANGGFYTWRGVIAEILPDGPEKEEHIAKIVEAIFALPFPDYYYDGAIEALERLAKLGQVVIFSQGEDILQHKKVQCLVDKRIVQPSDIYIYEDKIAEIPSLLAKVDGKKKIVLDDLAKFLIAFAEADRSVITVLVETRELNQDFGTFSPTIRAKSFPEAAKKVEAMLV